MSSSLSGISSLATQSLTTDAGSISIPANLTPAQSAEVEQILGQLASGSITAAQAASEIAGIASQGTSQSSSGPTSGVHHGHHHHADATNDAASGQTLSSALGLSTDQESQIASIVQSAQQNGTEPATVLTQIEGVLTPEQQQKLAQLLSPTYSSIGTNATGSGPPLFSTTA